MTSRHPSSTPDLNRLLELPVSAGASRTRKTRALAIELGGDGVASMAAAITDMVEADRQAAIPMANALVRVARALPAGADRQRGVALALRARAGAKRGLLRVRAALRDYRAARLAFDAIGDDVEAARTGIGMVDALIYLRRYEDAQDLADEVGRTLVAHGERRRAARLRVNIANMHIRTGDLAAAIADLETAAAEFRDLDEPRDAAVVGFNLAIVHADRGDWSAAETGFARAATTFSDAGADAAVVQCRLGEADAQFHRGRVSDALQTVNRALDRANDLGDDTLRATALSDLVKIEAALNLQSECVHHVDTLIPLGTRSSLIVEVGEAHLLRAGVLADLGRRRAAEADVRAAREAADEVNDRNLQTAALVAEASLRLRTGDVAGARRVATRAGGTKTGHRIEPRAALVRAASAVSERAFVTAMSRVDAHLADRPDPWLAFDAADVRARRTRLPEDFERAHDRLVALRRAAPPDVAQQSFLRDKSLLFDAAVESALDRGDVERAFRWAERSRQRVLNEHLARLHGSVDDRDVGGSAAAAARLPQGTVLVEYHVTDRRVVAFVVGDGPLRAVDVPATRGELDEIRRRLDAVWARNGVMRGATQRESVDRLARHLLAELGRRLVGPLSDALREASSVIFVPHDIVNGIPLHAVTVDDAPLSSRWDVSYLPSADTLSFVDRPRRDDRGHALIVGVASDAAPRAEAEAMEIAREFDDARLLLGPDATRERIARGVVGARVIHIASHASLRSDSPLMSGFAAGDGWMTVHDVHELATSADVAVLSACRTGVGVSVGGDEAIGIMRGFLRAGVPQLLATQWSVDDQATRSFMIDFYHRFTADGDARRSLNRVYRAHSGVGRDVYEWAPFVLYGAPS